METRESKKSLYMDIYMQTYRIELSNTIWTESESLIDLFARNAWDDRKKDIKNKADAAMWANIDAKTRCMKIREEIKKALNK